MLDSNFTINNTTLLTLSESCYFLSATSETELTFTNSAFEDIDRPVLEFDDSNNSPITISGSNFSKLHSSQATGGAIQSDVSNTISLSIEDMKFSSCILESSDSKGGACYINLIDYDDSLSFDNVTWDSTNNADFGKQLFILSSSTDFSFINNTAFPDISIQNEFILHASTSIFGNSNVDFIIILTL
jgi:hypothetical protein